MKMHYKGSFMLRKMVHGKWHKHLLLKILLNIFRGSHLGFIEHNSNLTELNHFDQLKSTQPNCDDIS